MSTAVAVAVGGALGAVSRWAVTVGMLRLTGPGFPWGTLMVNVTGSFLVGVAVVWAQNAGLPETYRHFLTVGLLGSFTTFSTYSLETLTLVETGAWLRAGSYALGSLSLGLAAVWAGMTLASRMA